jgi:hypothetical protein
VGLDFFMLCAIVRTDFVTPFVHIFFGRFVMFLRRFKRARRGEPKPRKERKPLSHDLHVVLRFVVLPTDWVMSWSPSDHRSKRHVPLLGRGADPLKVRAFFDTLISAGDAIVLADDDRLRMERLLEIHERVGRHLLGNRINMLVPDHLETVKDSKTGMTIHAMLATDDPDQFESGYDAVCRIFP